MFQINLILGITELYRVEEISDLPYPYGSKIYLTTRITFLLLLHLPILTAFTINKKCYIYTVEFAPYQYNLVNTNLVNTTFRIIRTNIYAKLGPYIFQLIYLRLTNFDRPLVFVLTRFYCQIYRQRLNTKIKYIFS